MLDRRLAARRDADDAQARALERLGRRAQIGGVVVSRHHTDRARRQCILPLCAHRRGHRGALGTGNCRRQAELPAVARAGPSRSRVRQSTACALMSRSSPAVRRGAATDRTLLEAARPPPIGGARPAGARSGGEGAERADGRRGRAGGGVRANPAGPAAAPVPPIGRCRGPLRASIYDRPVSRFSVIVADDHPLFREGVVRAVRAWPELELVARGQQRAGGARADPRARARRRLRRPAAAGDRRHRRRQRRLARRPGDARPAALGLRRRRARLPRARGRSGRAT